MGVVEHHNDMYNTALNDIYDKMIEREELIILYKGKKNPSILKVLQAYEQSIVNDIKEFNRKYGLRYTEKRIVKYITNLAKERGIVGQKTS